MNTSSFVAVLFLGLTLTCLKAAAPADSPVAGPGFLEQKVIPDDGVGNDGFGYGVAVSGSTAMVGEGHATINGNEAQGEVDVFEQSGGQWFLKQKLTASDGAADDSFGVSIAIYGNTAIIGAVGVQADRGAVYVFTKSDGVWTQTAKNHGCRRPAGRRLRIFRRYLWGASVGRGQGCPE